jgi:hypothetical protein
MCLEENIFIWTNSVCIYRDLVLLASDVPPGFTPFRRDSVTLARQRKLQITRYFTTQMLHYHKLESDSEDYKLEQVSGFKLPGLFVVLKRFLELQSAGILSSTLRLIT